MGLGKSFLGMLTLRSLLDIHGADGDLNLFKVGSSLEIKIGELLA